MLVTEHQDLVSPEVFPQSVGGCLVDTVGQVNTDDLGTEQWTGRDDLVRGGLCTRHLHHLAWMTRNQGKSIAPLPP
jgi:hypothetical protein